MKARIKVEWGSDALDGGIVNAAQGEVMRTVSLSVNNGITEGGFQLAVAGSPVPVEVRFRRVLLTPGQHVLDDTYLRGEAESPAGGSQEAR